MEVARKSVQTSALARQEVRRDGLGQRQVQHQITHPRRDEEQRRASMHLCIETKVKFNITSHTGFTMQLSISKYFLDIARSPRSEMYFDTSALPNSDGHITT